MPPQPSRIEILPSCDVRAAEVSAIRRVSAQLLDRRRQQAIALHRAGKLYAARAVYEQVLRVTPSDPDVLHLLGLVRLQCDEFAKAIKLIRKAIAIQPAVACYYGSLSKAYHEAGLYREAMAAAQVALKLNPRSLVARISLGSALCACGARAEAARHLRRAFRQSPHNVSVLAALATLAERENRLADAMTIVRRQQDCDASHLGLALTTARLLRRVDKPRQALRHLLDVRRINPRHDRVPHLHFELGQLYDQLEQPDRAFRCFTRAQELKRRRSIRLKSRRNRNLDLAHLRDTFTTEWVKGWRPLQPFPREQSPIFVFGFPRSGNTLLAQMLHCHPRLQTLLEKPMADAAQQVVEHLSGGYPGALATLTEAEADRARRAYFEVARQRTKLSERALVDAFPLNTPRIGLLHRLFPRARLVFVVRHPCDVCLSCFMQNFSASEVSWRFNTLEGIAAAYTQVMDLWRQYCRVLGLDFHIVRYETLIADLSGEMQSLCRYLDIPWDDALSRYATPGQPHAADTASYSQVTQRLYDRSRFRWRRYARYLGPVLPVLRPHAERFGYSLEHRLSADAAAKEPADWLGGAVSPRPNGDVRKVG